MKRLLLLLVMLFCAWIFISRGRVLFYLSFSIVEVLCGIAAFVAVILFFLKSK